MADEITITDETSAGDLRKAYEKMKDRAAAAERQAGELLSEKRTTTVADILKAKGAPAKAAKFYDGEADEASVTAWLKENEELFPVKAPDPTSPPGTTPVVTPAGDATGTLDPNVLAAALASLATASGGDDGFGLSNPNGAPTMDADRVAQITELMRSAPRTPEGYAQLAAAGIFPTTPGI